jgi:hypothetical protein
MSEQKQLPDGVLGFQCKFSIFCPPPRGDRDDLHLVKETIHYTNGTTKPNVRLIKNFKRPIYVTKKGYQQHQDKKEWEDIDRLDRYETTESEKTYAIKKALNMHWHKGDPRELSRSPYLYGSDILSTCVLKKSYMDKFPGLNAIYDVAAFDIESDVVNGTKQIIMATLSYRGRVFTAIQKSFVEGLVDVERRLESVFDKYIGDVYADRKIKWEKKLVDAEIDVVLECMKKAHEWKPDFIAIWNITYDMGMMLDAISRAGHRPEDVFSDPAVPPNYRYFKFKKGTNKKVTASGKVMPIPPQAQWHTVFCPASFYFIDAMCVYFNLRSQKGKDPSYRLDAILAKTFKGEIRKLKFEEANSVRDGTIDWHKLMQSKFKLEYIIYNVFDCVGMELLDEKIKDLQLTLPSFAEWTDFSNFNSQPRRLVDKLHYFCLEHGKVIGSTSDEMKVELDNMTTSLANWIVTLPAHLVADNGLCWIEENPMMRTNIRAHVGDLDVAASYPNGECTFNISKETTSKELIKIDGVSNRTQRIQGINLSGGATNSYEVCVELFGMPTLDQWLAEFGAQRGQTFQIPHYQHIARGDASDDALGIDPFAEEDLEDEEDYDNDEVEMEM